MFGYIMDEPINNTNKRGRPSGVSKAKTCPHKWTECYGPVGFSERARMLLEGLQRYECLDFIAGLVSRDLIGALNYVGMTADKTIEMQSSPCPYGLSCVSPRLAGQKLLAIEELLIKAEDILIENEGVWLSYGESPLYHLSTMVMVFGYQKEAQGMLKRMRQRLHKHRVNNKVT